jgi:hypothetical protein
VATALVAVSISHIQTSRKLAVTRSALTIAQNELGVLTIGESEDIHAIALPPPGGMHWRWRIQLPKGNTFRLRWDISDSVPKSGLPTLPEKPDYSNIGSLAFFKGRGNSWPAEDPMILNLTVARDRFGEWKLTWSNPDRSSSHKIDAPPSWLTQREGGMSARITGRGETEHGAADEPFVLLRYRKTKTTSTGASTVDMKPTNGMIVWIEAAE